MSAFDVYDVSAARNATKTTFVDSKNNKGKLNNILARARGICDRNYSYTRLVKVKIDYSDFNRWQGVVFKKLVNDILVKIGKVKLDSNNLNIEVSIMGAGSDTFNTVVINQGLSPNHQLEQHGHNQAEHAGVAALTAQMQDGVNIGHGNEEQDIDWEEHPRYMNYYMARYKRYKASISHPSPQNKDAKGHVE